MDACDLPINTIHLHENEVWYNVNYDIGGFQWDVNGAYVINASGGDATQNGFTIQATNSFIIGFDI